MQSAMRYLHAARIKVLLALSPARLFQEISRLDWYSDTLTTWIDCHLEGSGQRVLDVGCATGYLTEYLFHEGQDVTDVDISNSMIEAAKRRNPQIDFRLSTVDRLPFGREAFDLVVSASVINISKDPEDLVAQIHEVCKRGGRATFLFPVDDFTDEDMHRSIAMLGISGFSASALTAWHRSAPKMRISDAREILIDSGFRHCESRRYLNGMVASVSAQKVDQELQ